MTTLIDGCFIRMTSDEVYISDSWEGGKVKRGEAVVRVVSENRVWVMVELADRANSVRLSIPVGSLWALRDCLEKQGIELQ